MTESPRRTCHALLGGAVAVAGLVTALPASAATARPAPTASDAIAACTSGLKFTDPYYSSPRNHVRAGFRMTTTCGGKASIRFWVNGPVDNAWDLYWEFQPGGGGYGRNFVVGTCRPGTYEAFFSATYAAADGTSVEIRRDSINVRINC